MIDIHIHLIPAVDDGAEDQNMSLLMLLRAKEQGITHIFATPHSSAFDEHPKEVLEAFQNLYGKAAQMLPDMTLYLGCEVYCEADRMPEVLEKLRSGEYPTMNGTKYVLMEFSRWVQPEAAVPCVKTLVEAGYIPIIAHMEHYRHLQNNKRLVQQFRELGAKIQLNMGSLFDEMDEATKAWAPRCARRRRGSAWRSRYENRSHCVCLPKTQWLFFPQNFHQHVIAFRLEIRYNGGAQIERKRRQIHGSNGV